MRAQRITSAIRSPARTNSRGTAGGSGSGAGALRVVRAKRDQLGVAWSAETDPLCWQVVCWDSRDAAVARLKLTGGHPAGDLRGSCSFAAAVHDRRLRAGRRWLRALAGRACRSVSAGRSPRWVTARLQPHAGAQARKVVSQGRREPVSPKRPKKDPAPAKFGKTRKAKPKKKTARGK